MVAKSKPIKPKSPRKKKVAEAGQFQVDMMSNRPGAPVDAVTKTVTAGTDQEALRKATQGDPQVAKYNQIKLTKPTPGQPVMRPQAQMNKMAPVGAPTAPILPQQPIQPQQPIGATTEAKKRVSRKKTDPNTMELVERLTYPYTMSMGRFYKPIFRPAEEAKTAKVMEANGRVYVKVYTKEDMIHFLKSIAEQKTPHAKMILEGIRKHS